MFRFNYAVVFLLSYLSVWMHGHNFLCHSLNEINERHLHICLSDKHQWYWWDFFCENSLSKSKAIVSIFLKIWNQNLYPGIPWYHVVVIVLQALVAIQFIVIEHLRSHIKYKLTIFFMFLHSIYFGFIPWKQV